MKTILSDATHLPAGFLQVGAFFDTTLSAMPIFLSCTTAVDIFDSISTTCTLAIILCSAINLPTHLWYSRGILFPRKGGTRMVLDHTLKVLVAPWSPHKTCWWSHDILVSNLDLVCHIVTSISLMYTLNIAGENTLSSAGSFAIVSAFAMHLGLLTFFGQAISQTELRKVPGKQHARIRPSKRRVGSLVNAYAAKEAARKALVTLGSNSIQ